MEETIMQIGGRALGVAALVLAGLLATAAPALAHNSLTGSDPEDGETVEHAPDQLQLTFFAAVDPNNAEFDVTGPDGSSVIAGDPEVAEKTVRVPIRPGPAGDYEVAWRVLSSDADWVAGTVAFTVSPSATPSATPSAVPAAGEVGDDAGGSGPAWWVWAVLAVLVVAAAGSGGYRLRRRMAENR
jgi:hypothetical protein